MFHQQQNHESYWQEIDPPLYTPLLGTLHTDVCIVGAGIAGVMTAYILLKNGFKVVLIDKEPFGENETARTSAHLSFVLDEGFRKLITLHGETKANQALSSHSDAIDLIEKIIAEENIACDFKRIPGFLYLSPDTEREDFEEEFEASIRLGAPCELLPSPPYFAHFGPAISYPQQARIHPLKFLKGLLSAIQKMGGQIYGLTAAVEFHDGDSTFVKTSNGSEIYAKSVVVTTNVPVNDRFHMHTKEAAYRTYIIGVEVPAGSFPDILFWDTAEPYHYVRLIPEYSSGKDLVIVGGEDHRVGQEPHTDTRFENLYVWAKERLHLEGEIVHRWSGQIIEPTDGLAFIGKNPGDDNIFISTGDSGHGLTHGAIASMVIRDLLQNTVNEWADLYSPSRINLRATMQFVKENTNILRQYTERIHVPKEWTKDHLQPGEGSLAQIHGQKIALYCNENNEIKSFSAICPHLGGVVHWNETEKTWDCPCHGSRFAATGEVINGPAISGLKETPVDQTKIEKPLDKQEPYKGPNDLRI